MFTKLRELVAVFKRPWPWPEPRREGITITEEFHDPALGHVRVGYYPNGDFYLQVGRRDVQVRDGEVVGSGFFLAEQPPVPGCERCVVEDSGRVGYLFGKAPLP